MLHELFITHCLSICLNKYKHLCLLPHHFLYCTADLSNWMLKYHYVLGELQGLDVACTVDSEASNTVVSSRVYQRILEDVHPRLFQGVVQ